MGLEGPRATLALIARMDLGVVADREVRVHTQTDDKRFGTDAAAPQLAVSSRDANSPIMMLGAFVLAEGIVGMIEASAMRRPSMPWHPEPTPMPGSEY